MFKPEKLSHRVIDLLLLIALVIGLGLVLENGSLLPQTQQWEGTYPSPTIDTKIQPVSPTQENNSPTPYPAPEENSSEFAVVQSEIMPSPCKFQSDLMPYEHTSKIEDYIFSDPQIVLTTTKETVNISLVDWLPDNQHILIVRDEADATQPIGLFDPSNRDFQVLAIRKFRSDVDPVWQSALNTVAYTELFYPNGINKPDIFSRQLWIGRGGSEKAQLLADNLANENLAYNSSGDQIAYFVDRNLVVLDSNLKQAFGITLSPAIKGLEVERWDSDWMLHGYQVAWRPGTEQFVLYGVFRTNNFIPLIDVYTGQICRLDIGGWAGVLRWSPNGRYLAAIRAKEDIPVKTSDLIVLDMNTGQQYVQKIVTDQANIPYGIKDIAWSPDSQSIIVLAHYSEYPTSDSRNRQIHSGLYLVDFLHEKNIQVLPQYQFKGFLWGTNLAWSPDGKKLLVSCRKNALQFCLIDVNTISQ
jgi:dipeptidyl aminopeptidase/acylaminoacyl peptidase